MKMAEDKILEDRRKNEKLLHTPMVSWIFTRWLENQSKGSHTIATLFKILD